MLGSSCFRRNTIAFSQLSSFSHPQIFSLPAPILQWPQGQGFASGLVNLGEIEVFKVTKFEYIWSSAILDTKKAVVFYKPVGIPNNFHILGHYCQPSDKPLRGFVLVAKETGTSLSETNEEKLPPLRNPLDFKLFWSSNAGSQEISSGCGYFWLPEPPEGYKAIGYFVTNKPDKPELDEMCCVRADLTDECEPYRIIFSAGSRILEFSFQVWSLRPCDRGMLGKGVSVGTFLCSSGWSNGEEHHPIACLKNLNPLLPSMPNLQQIHALIEHYGPTVFFHPNEIYLPSSVDWFFDNGALLYRKGVSTGERIDATGSNLPCGGSNDGQFWIDLPSDDRRDFVKRGDLKSARLYVHVKPAVGGTFTDIVFWVFCPFNGPATLKIGIKNIPLSKIGEHVGDWEHFTLRICNFAGELYSIYFSQHSGGEWVDAHDLDYIDGNKAIVYSSKSGHASYPHPGTYIQGSSKLGLGIRNDAVRSNLYLDSSVHYELVAAEYLENVVAEPNWLQFMREWGPKIVYDLKTELDKIINALPRMLRYSMRNLFNKFPVELYGEEGPTGPKEKNNWIQDERW
ncbi:hypothetical protein At1g04090-like [Cicer arietinum]|uniref:Uncharacterized protein LOC101493338 n=1 Tax=Cicer arietinum TaxID=3827 RepID=A0A1S2YJA6_CICAR|nr:uncharacterized protein LOC101493338 [Cicer arietinum]